MKYTEENKKVSSLNKMHPMQIDALMNFIGISLSVAAALEDESAMEAVKESADDLILMLGGNGLKVETRH
tara:strand:+ start:115 stop:324 length:210 start_codon:yes stop_codon:yes gene_type:complete